MVLPTVGSTEHPIPGCSRNPCVQGYLAHKKPPPPRTSGPVPRALWRSWGVGGVLMSVVPLCSIAYHKVYGASDSGVFKQPLCTGVLRSW